MIAKSSSRPARHPEIAPIPDGENLGNSVWHNEVGASAAFVRDVLAGLYDGRFTPGQRLIEANLTASYGISRGPVREALRGLAALGIVDLAPQRGAHIRLLTIDQAIDILEVAATLLSCAAGSAAKNIQQPGARDRMQTALDGVTAGGVGDLHFVHARNQFYSTITSIAGNQELRRVLPSAQIHIIRVQFRDILKDHDSTRSEDYRRIAEAVLAGDRGSAAAAMHFHLHRAINSLRPQRHGPEQNLPCL
jgi:DNA-binding GntR family transcriptional regulator